jgi:hypothetical protein
MKTYNHAFTVAFSVSGSTHPEGEDITDAQFYQALRARAEDLYLHGEFQEAVGAPYDTYEEPE